jgi:hypothetical protein
MFLSGWLKTSARNGKPTGGARRRLLDRPGPGNTREWALNASERRISAHGQQRHARAFAECQFEIAPTRITNQDFTNERRLWAAIGELTIASSPGMARLRELMNRASAKTQRDSQHQCGPAHIM